MQHRFALAFAALLALACADPSLAPEPTTPELDVAADVHADGRVRKIKMRDTCDPDTFNAVLGPGTCLLEKGRTTFDEFIAELSATQNVVDWENDPRKARERVGTTLEIRNTGGEVHTFTRVAQFGGGFIDELNQLAGTPIPAPECLNIPALGFVPGGGSETQVVPAKGENHYQCCLHPWMRTTIEGR